MQTLKNALNKWQCIDERSQNLLGVCLLKLGSGGLAIWGNCSVYIFSYLKHYNQNLTQMKIHLMILVMAIIIGGSTMLSLKLSQMYGHIRLINIFMMSYPIFIIISSFCVNYILFCLFYLFLSGASYGFAMMPILYCLWSHYDQGKRGSVTGLAMTCFGISTVFYNILITHLINPHNESADEIYIEKNQEYQLFSSQVISNVQNAIGIIGCIYGFFIFIGVQYVSEYKIEQQKQINSPLLQKEICQEETIDLVNYYKKLLMESKEKNADMRDLTKEKNLFIEMKNLYNSIDSSEQSFQDQVKNQDEQDQPIIYSHLNFKEAIVSKPFIICYLITYIISLFALFLGINFKIYGLRKLGNDHLVMYTVTIATVIGSLSNLAWGRFLDKFNYKNVLLVLIFLTGIFAITLPMVSDSAVLFFLWFTAIGVCERGLYTIIGPILLQIYGLELGTKLFPFISTSFFVALVSVTGLQVILLHFYKFDSVLTFFGLIIFFAILLTMRLDSQQSQGNEKKIQLTNKKSSSPIRHIKEQMM